MINWNEIAEGAGYATEQAMWDDLFLRQGMSMRRIQAKIGGIYPTAESVRNRLKRLGYKMRPPGGPNNPIGRKSGYLERILAIPGKEGKTAMQISEGTGISFNTVQTILRRHGIKYKKLLMQNCFFKAWKPYFAEHDVSGLTCKQVHRQTGIPISTLAMWKRKGLITYRLKWLVQKTPYVYKTA